jgi:hypothetical protein
MINAVGKEKVSIIKLSSLVVDFRMYNTHTIIRR